MKKTSTLAEAFEEICVMDAPLNERLAAYAERLKELGFPFSEAYDALVAKLIAGEIGTRAPVAGEAMPLFILPAKSGTLVALDELTAKGPVVISFNRGHWCPFCKIELKTIAAHHNEIAAHGAEVVSIMPDRQKFVGRLRADTLENLRILTDIDNGYALSLGLVMWLGERLRELMRGRGYHLETFHGNDGWFVPLPATFVVGSNGRVIARFVDPDFRKRMEIEDILAALRLDKR
ncbi:MAG TPA: peroxiredoxin-like family protein [Hyphomicrobiaceae bacterium]|nr:peroxiredoxin-like family protein [Hyphomicrobiaceae bacterium]